MKAKGSARHHFWGFGYSATIFLTFDSAEDAAAALPKLVMEDMGTVHDVTGNVRESAGWVIHPLRPTVLAVMAADPALERILDQLEGFGANRKKILSCGKSIDSGEPFTVKIPK